MSILGGVRVFHREYRTVSAGISVPLLHSLEVVPYATPEGCRKKLKPHELRNDAGAVIRSLSPAGQTTGKVGFEA